MAPAAAPAPPGAEPAVSAANSLGGAEQRTVPHLLGSAEEAALASHVWPSGGGLALRTIHTLSAQVTYESTSHDVS